MSPGAGFSKPTVREYAGVGLALLVALVCFFPDVFWLRSGLLAGDYRLWHVPLARLLAEGQTLWTSRIGCGFPLFAEGQAGWLYPLTFAAGKLLPWGFAAVYNGLTLFQYWLAVLLGYLYVRSLGVSRAGAFAAALLYGFGAAQGGYLTNASSQKALTWFPLMLLLIDRALAAPGALTYAWLGALFGLQIGAGHPQSAAYSAFFGAVYLGARLALLPERGAWAPRLARVLGGLALAGIVAGIVGGPQIAATRELAAFSNRGHLPEAFAYVGSLPPQGFAGVVFPFLDAYLGPVSLYGGLLAILLAAAAWRMRARWDGRLAALALMAGAALLVALGGYDPLYRLAVRLTGFHALRVPSRAAYFALLAWAALAGWGWDRLLVDEPDEGLRRTARRFMVFAAAAFAGVLVAGPLLRALKPWLEQAGLEVIRRQFTGNPLHPYGVEVYQAKLRTFLGGLLAAASPATNPRVGWWAALFGLHGFWAWHCARAQGTARRALAGMAGALIVLDLLAYNTAGPFRTQLGTYARQAEQDGAWAQAVRAGGEGRLFVYCTDLSERERLPLFFNAGAAHGVDEVGLYTPLAPERHRAYFEGLGANDNSLFLAVADPARFAALKSLLDAAHARWLIGLAAPPGPGWRERLRRGEAALYENEQVLPRVYRLPAAAAVTTGNFNAYARRGAFDPWRQVVFEQAGAPLPPAPGNPARAQAAAWTEARGVLTAVTEAAAPGWLVAADADYPGWRARVNGAPAEIRRANGIFRAVAVPAGKATVEFVYAPAYARWLWLPGAGWGLLSLISLLALARAARRRP